MAVTLSALIPNCNHAAFLPATIACLLAQTRRADEVIVIADGSTLHQRANARRSPGASSVPSQRSAMVPRHTTLDTSRWRAEFQAPIPAVEAALDSVLEP